MQEWKSSHDPNSVTSYGLSTMEILRVHNLLDVTFYPQQYVVILTAPAGETAFFTTLFLTDKMGNAKRLVGNDL